MALYVQKFGGTSVGSVDRIKAVAEKVKGFRDQGHQVVVVVSAMSGETNRLTDMAHALNEDPAPREMDMLLSTGEQVTISLLAMALQQAGVPPRRIPARRSAFIPTVPTPRRVFSVSKPMI